MSEFPNADDGPRRPLAGITVISCEQAVAAPLATRHLADLGARVIKIERPIVGDFARDYDEAVRGMSSHFVWLNRGKESVTLNLKHPEAAAVMQALIAKADVFIQNLAPSAADRLGLGAKTLSKAYPSLVTCAISGYGPSGPYRDAKAYDLLIQSEVGLVSITGTEAAPAKAGIPVADIAAGMYAFSGILAALFERSYTDRGAQLEISLFDSLAEWMSYPLYYGMHGGSSPGRAGTSHAAIAPYGSFAAGDGTQFVLSVQSDREWRAFCSEVLRDTSVADDARFSTGAARVQNRVSLENLIVGVLSRLSGQALGERLARAGIANARQRDVLDVPTHPQLVERDRWVLVDSPVGPIEALLPPITFVGRRPSMGAVPALGAHTAHVLHEAGYTAHQVERLRAEGLL